MASSTGPSRSSASAIQANGVPSIRPAVGRRHARTPGRAALGRPRARPLRRAAAPRRARPNHGGGSPRQDGACAPGEAPRPAAASQASSGRRLGAEQLGPGSRSASTASCRAALSHAPASAMELRTAADARLGRLQAHRVLDARELGLQVTSAQPCRCWPDQSPRRLVSRSAPSPGRRPRVNTQSVVITSCPAVKWPRDKLHHGLPGQST